MCLFAKKLYQWQAWNKTTVRDSQVPGPIFTSVHGDRLQFPPKKDRSVIIANTVCFALLETGLSQSDCNSHMTQTDSQDGPWICLRWL